MSSVCEQKTMNLVHHQEIALLFCLNVLYKNSAWNNGDFAEIVIPIFKRLIITDDHFPTPCSSCDRKTRFPN